MLCRNHLSTVRLFCPFIFADKLAARCLNSTHCDYWSVCWQCPSLIKALFGVAALADLKSVSRLAWFIHRGGSALAMTLQILKQACSIPPVTMAITVLNDKKKKNTVRWGEEGGVTSVLSKTYLASLSACNSFVAQFAWHSSFHSWSNSTGALLASLTNTVWKEMIGGLIMALISDPEYRQ